MERSVCAELLSRIQPGQAVERASFPVRHDADEDISTNSLMSTQPSALGYIAVQRFASSEPSISDHVSQDEPHIRRTLGQAAHEIRIPVAPIRHIHSQSISVAHELLLQIAPYAVEHLKLELVRLDVLLVNKCAGRSDDVLIVSRDPVIDARGQQSFRELDVVFVNVVLFWERDGRRLLVRAFA